MTNVNRTALTEMKTLAFILFAMVGLGNIGYIMYWCFVLPFLDIPVANSVVQDTIGLVLVQVSSICLNVVGFLISVKGSSEASYTYLSIMFAADLFFSCFIIPPKIAFLWNIREKYFHILFCVAAAFMALSTSSFVATCISHITFRKPNASSAVKPNNGQSRIRKLVTFAVIIAYSIAVGKVNDFYSDNENQALYITVLELLIPIAILLIVASLAAILHILAPRSPCYIFIDASKVKTYTGILITYVVFSTPQCVFLVLQLRDSIVDWKTFSKVNHVLFGMFVLKSCLSPVLCFLFDPTWRFQLFDVFSRCAGTKKKDQVTSDRKYILYTDPGEAV